MYLLHQISLWIGKGGRAKKNVRRSKYGMSSKTALAHGTVSSIGCHVSATESNAARACVRRDVVENQMRPTR